MVVVVVVVVIVVVVVVVVVMVQVMVVILLIVVGNCVVVVMSVSHFEEVVGRSRPHLLIENRQHHGDVLVPSNSICRILGQHRP